MIGIYKIVSPSEKIYVGQSIRIEERFLSYKNLSGVRGQKGLQNSFYKYGVENHIFEILEECDIEELNNKERYWQDYYNVLKYGLNCKLTTSDDKSGFLTKEVCEKISKSHIGIKPNEETRLKMSISAKNRIRKPYSKEHSKAISDAKKGKTFSEKHKLALSKKVIDTETNIIYDSVKIAALEFNLNKNTLIQYLSGHLRNKTNLIYLDNYEIQN